MRTSNAPPLVAGGLLAGLSWTHAATYTVVNTDDAGMGFLRKAITDANANPNADVIRLGANNADKGNKRNGVLPDGASDNVGGVRITINAPVDAAGNWTNTAYGSAAEFDVLPGNNSLVLAWPSWASGFQLQTETNLTPVIYRIPVTNAVAEDGPWKRATLTPQMREPTRFCRLVH